MSPPTRSAPQSLPPNPSLDLLGNLAKQLRKRLRQRDSTALDRILEHHPHTQESASSMADGKFSLRYAQIVIAREYGFASWAALKRHVEATRETLGGEAVTVDRLVPQFTVFDLTASLSHYVDRLGFAVKHEWVDDGRLAGCRLEHGSVALALQQSPGRGKSVRTPGGLGEGIRIACLAGGDESHWPHHGHLVETSDDDGFTLLASKGWFAPGPYTAR